MTAQILVTGASGNVGGELVKQLRASGVPVRVAVRDVARSRARFGEGVVCVSFDFEDPTTYRQAFAGVRRLFLVRPPQLADAKRQINPAVDAAREAGVKQIVFLSVVGAERNRFVPHHQIEQHIRQSGVGYTFLRPAYFMQNLSTTHRAPIRSAGEICLPTGQGRMSLIDARDVAAVAARTLTEEGHLNKAYTLTGSEALSFREVAATFTEELGRPIRFTNPSFRAYRQQMAGLGFDRGLINVTSVMYLLCRMGLSAGLTEDVPHLLGRAPLTLRQFLHDYADAWAPEE